MRISFIHIDSKTDKDNIANFANNNPTNSDFRNILVLDKGESQSIITEINSKLTAVGSVEWIQNTNIQGRVPSLMYAYERVKDTIDSDDILIFHISEFMYSLGVGVQTYEANTLVKSDVETFSTIYGCLAWSVKPDERFTTSGILCITKNTNKFIWSVLQAMLGKGGEAYTISMLIDTTFNIRVEQHITKIETNDDLYKYHNIAILESVFGVDIFPSICKNFRAWIERNRKYTLMKYFTNPGIQTFANMYQKTLFSQMKQMKQSGTVYCITLTKDITNTYYKLNHQNQLQLPAGTFVYMDGTQVVSGTILDSTRNYIIFKIA